MDDATDKTPFLADLKAKARALAPFYGLSEQRAAEFGHALAILVSADYGTQYVYIRRDNFIEGRHAAVYARYRAVHQQESSVERAVQQVAADTGYSDRQVYRILSKLGALGDG